MATCGKTFKFEMGTWEVSDFESKDAALAAARQKIIDVIDYNNKNKCDGDCVSVDEETCTVTWPSEDLDDFCKTLKTDEYKDDDGDTSYGVSIPDHTWKLTCKCRKRGKKKTGKKKK